MTQEIIIEKFAPPGTGLGFVDKLAVFVPASTVGDRLLIELVKEKKNYAEGRILEIVEPGPDRIVPPCPHYLECGGCDLMHLSMDRQLDLKAQMLCETLLSHGIDWQGQVVPSPLTNHYRFKANLKLSKDSQGKIKLGLNRRQSSNVIEIPHCKILAKPILDTIPKIDANNLPECDIPLLTGRQKSQVAGMILTAGKHQSLPGFHFAVQEDYGFGLIELRAANFAQANPWITEMMLKDITDACGSAMFALELYAGSGTITTALAKIVPRVLAVENNDKAVKVLKQNLKNLGLDRVQCKTETAGKIKIPDSVDLIVVDPPRAGLDKVTTKKLSQSNAQQILYMSCNPASQARDLKLLLKEGGFKLDWLKAYDMYCHSTHSETLVLLIR